MPRSPGYAAVPTTSCEEHDLEAQNTPVASSNEVTQPCTVNLRFVDGKTQEVPFIETETVRQFKQRIFSSEVQQGKSIRLICQGKLLDDSKPLAAYGVKPGSFFHVAISEGRPVSASVSSETSDTPENQRLLLPGSRGFDQFREAGVPAPEIELMRLQFYRQLDLSAQNATASTPSSAEPTPSRRLRMEEEWLNGNMRDLAASQSRLQLEEEYNDDPREGSTADMIWGMLMGFVLGVIMLLWVFESGTPRKQKLGIFLGAACNVSLNLLRYYSR
eukprot:GILK01005327.1.p1 GENE.GILK01005327.1~~GILK01005327.1.p1  ORF type:complete len:274 (-),score=26.54 GILK01005327.1:198-1019(-)